MYAFIKRTFDIVFSALMLILLSPIMAMTALMVKIKLGGPVIFVNYRPGKNGKVFALYKFRTMSNAKDENGILLPDSQRWTKFGKALRATSLDELPQLWNILKGDMSLIGPRPMIVRDAMYYGAQGNMVYELAVRPGITGLAQIDGRNNSTWENTFKNNEYYCEHMSLWLDIKIFFKTIKVVLSKSNTEKRKYAYYNDYLLAIGVIDKKEYERGINYHNLVEKNCALGITQYVTPFGTIPTLTKTKKKAVKVGDELLDDEDKLKTA